MKKNIKLFDPVVGKEEIKTINHVLKSRFWASGAGTGYVEKFENKFNKFIGSKQCVALNSGTAALHLALSLYDIRNKEVILPSLSFVSTASAVLYNGGIPVFVDVNPKTLCIDPVLVKEKVTEKTRIILPVHFGGMSCDLNKLQNICKKHNIILIEDAAHASGAKYHNKKIGSHGDLVCFSFHPVKNLAMPTGGAVTINSNNSKKLKKILEIRRWCGISDRKGLYYDITDLGWNYYMNEFSAAIGLAQLKKLDKMNNTRKNIAKRYSKELNIDKKMLFNKNCSYHLYWIQVKNRNNFIKKMMENNIETGIHYKPIHKMKFYRQQVKLPNTDSLEDHIISIPTHPNLTDSDVSKIIKLVNKFS